MQAAAVAGSSEPWQRACSGARTIRRAGGGMSPNGANGKHILIVEDDPELREALLGALASSGYAAVADADAQHALERLRSAGTTPALVLLDLHLPGMTGLELLKTMREDAALAPIPIAVMSAHQRLRRAAEPFEPCANLSKPVALDALLDVIERCVG